MNNGNTPPENINSNNKLGKIRSWGKIDLCPLEGSCFCKNVVYKCTVVSNKYKARTYIGSTVELQKDIGRISFLYT